MADSRPAAKVEGVAGWILARGEAEGCTNHMCSINLMVGAWQKGQITWIADPWLVVGHAIILIDLAAPLIYITSIVYTCLYIPAAIQIKGTTLVVILCRHGILAESAS